MKIFTPSYNIRIPLSQLVGKIYTFWIFLLYRKYIFLELLTFIFFYISTFFLIQFSFFRKMRLPRIKKSIIFLCWF